uniref:C2 domain-containing protein n=1 Tax=Kalanchoe fedtschenkoi TaxID=63787 RepID=A0A7N0R7S5_KALFE
MECRNLEIFVRSASDLKEVNLFGKMDPYVSVSLSGDPNSKQKTEVHTDGGKNPKWKGKPMKFVINEDPAKNSNVTLVFKVMAEKPFGDKVVGEVYVPVKELLKDGSAEKAERPLSYGVKTPSGQSKGTLNFSYKLGYKFAYAAPKNMHEPVTAYPPSMAAGPSYAAPGPGYAQPYPPQYGSGPYPHQAGYGYPPTQAQGYPQPGYGYPGAPPPGPYGYPGAMAPQMVQPQRKKNKMGGMGLGLGAGLLGGLLIGDMAGDMAAYDAGFDDGFDF